MAGCPQEPASPQSPMCAPLPGTHGAAGPGESMGERLAVLLQPCQEGIHTHAQGVAALGGEGEDVPGETVSLPRKASQEAPTEELHLCLQV